MNMNTSIEKYLTITEVVYLFNAAFSDIFPKLFFEGEVSQVSRPSSGHLYFSLKDQSSTISCVMWRSTASKLSFNLQEGMKVQCGGKPEIYNVTGKFQLNITQIQPVGEGLLKKRFLELKAKLESEGLFDSARKRALPFLPKSIGIVTSGSGAVIHDIMVKIKERMPILKVTLIDVRVQGEGAALEISNAIKKFNADNEVEVIIVARGGGSLEDLWAFNEEILVRAVFASKIPIISGVGHEVDYTLCDFVADVRAPTPTAAAEMVVPKRDELLGYLDQLKQRLSRYQNWFTRFEQQLDDKEVKLNTLVNAKLLEKINKIQLLAEKLNTLHPKTLLTNQNNKLEHLRSRLQSVIKDRLSSKTSKLELLETRLQNLSPQKAINSRIKDLDLAKGKLNGIITNRINFYEQKVNSLSKLLDSINPKNTLKRGFSIVKKGSHVISQKEALSSGDTVEITFYEGELEAKII